LASEGLSTSRESWDQPQFVLHSKQRKTLFVFVRQIFKISGLIFFSISVLAILQKTARWHKKLKAVNTGNEITLFAAQSNIFAEIGPSLHMLKLNSHS